MQNRFMRLAITIKNIYSWAAGAYFILLRQLKALSVTTPNIVKERCVLEVK